MNRVRVFGAAYCIGFMLVVAIGYVPPFHDADGNLFGLFKLDLYDDSLHFSPVCGRGSPRGGPMARHAVISACLGRSISQTV